MILSKGVTVSKFVLMNDDCLTAMKSLPDDSVDSIVTDPPYGLKFMGKKWDHSVPSVEVWKECFRVLKPGGFLLSFGGTRTYHRLVVNVEDAGFEIRDMINWVYGSGFPKSHNISKGIDKSGGAAKAHVVVREELAKEIREKRIFHGVSRNQLAEWFPQYRYVTENWERLDDGFRVPSLDSYNILVEKLGVSEKWRGMVRADDLRTKKLGTKKDRVGDGTVYALGHTGNEYSPTTDESKQWDGWGTALKPAHEPIVMARKPFKGTVANNVLKHGTGGLNIDGCRVETKEDLGREQKDGPLPDKYGFNSNSMGNRFQPGNPQGRFPANLIHDGSDEVEEVFPHTKSGRSNGNANVGDSSNGVITPMRRGKLTSRSDDGSASRFFYCAKTSKKERQMGMEDPGVQFKHGDTLRKIENTKTSGNNHPTVKPIDLMKYLCRLVTQPNGVVLDPFMGSGSTGIAALIEGFKFIGIEMDEDYFKIAETRINHNEK
jgi:DNA modification methylase